MEYEMKIAQFIFLKICRSMRRSRLLAKLFHSMILLLLEEGWLAWLSLVSWVGNNLHGDGCVTKPYIF